MNAGATANTVDRALLARLRAICGPAHVIDDATTLATYRSDAAGHHRQSPAVAVLPADAGEVAAVLAACHRAGVAWVARGAGTGLTGAARPHRGGVLIVLTRLRRILSVDHADGRIVAEPGVSTAALSRAAAPTHFYAPDPASAAVSTIGGNVATNASGAHALKYGATVDHVLAIDLLLPDGSPLRLPRGAAGYDLLGAVVGSEGTLGIVVAIELGLVPLPETQQTLVASFDNAVAAATAAARIVASGERPSAIELLDGMLLAAAERAGAHGFRPDAGAVLLIDCDGPRRACATTLEAVTGLCARAGARDLRVALDRRERERLWRVPTIAFAAMRRAAAGYLIADAAVRPSWLATVLERIGALATELGLVLTYGFHAGTGNLTAIICHDAGSDSGAARARELAERIRRICLAAGGAIAGEHGVGVDARSLMPAMFSDADLAAFARLRSAFDPRGVANPDALLPTAGERSTRV